MPQRMLLPSYANRLCDDVATLYESFQGVLERTLTIDEELNLCNREVRARVLRVGALVPPVVPRLVQAVEVRHRPLQRKERIAS